MVLRWICMAAAVAARRNGGDLHFIGNHPLAHQFPIDYAKRFETYVLDPLPNGMGTRIINIFHNQIVYDSGRSQMWRHYFGRLDADRGKMTEATALDAIRQ